MMDVSFDDRSPLDSEAELPPPRFPRLLGGKYPRFEIDLRSFMRRVAAPARWRKR